ncbi:MAG: 50S ribosomal protein L29 [Candidatus Eremiobacteraeota bacterium]|nr:50S ribosomal protein L29 [Candidatus Eremiobacteraeota bacterium]
MKHDELTKLRDFTIAELQQKARETKEQLFNLRFQLRTGHLSDFSRVKATKREYAQIQTVVSEKRLADRPNAERNRFARARSAEAKRGAA